MAIRYLGATGKVVARFIHEFEGGEFPTPPPGSVAKGDSAP
jgi:hypothetical protein